MNYKKTNAVVVAQVALSNIQTRELTAPTPNQYIKTKPGRGNKPVKYVEGGYVTNQLNRVFGPLNWSFKVTERGESSRVNEKAAEGEVWVYGELTIHDHKRGYEVTKGQYGQHQIHKNVPMGDALKAAETDALKKCASLFGIALDVYWNQLDSGRIPTNAGTPVPLEEPPGSAAVRSASPIGRQAKSAVQKLSVFDRTKLYIQQTNDRTVLANLIQRIEGSSDLTEAQKYQLKKRTNEKLSAGQ